MSNAVAVRSCPPPLPEATIERTRLHAALDDAQAAAFTLVGAPPGWGKSVLLAAWAAPRGAAWLTLGSRHCDPRRLWADVVVALRRAQVPLEGLDSTPERLDDDFALRLADALAQAPVRPTLVLDDLDQLRGPGLAALGELIAGGGEAVHVVAATRSDPELPLERLRLAGRLHELRATDLAFTDEEAAALLAQL